MCLKIGREFAKPLRIIPRKAERRVTAVAQIAPERPGGMVMVPMARGNLNPADFAGTRYAPTSGNTAFSLPRTNLFRGGLEAAAWHSGLGRNTVPTTPALKADPSGSAAGIPLTTTGS